MLCTFKKLIYPKTVAAAQAGEYTVAIYTLNEKMLDAHNNPVKEAKVVGYFLPTAANVRVDMAGDWQRNAKHGVQFAMRSYTEAIQPSRQGTEA